MTAPELTAATLRDTLRLLAAISKEGDYYVDGRQSGDGRCSGKEEAARRLKISRTAFDNRLAHAHIRFGWTWRDFLEADIPEIEDDDLPDDKELRARLRKATSDYIGKHHANKRRIIPVRAEPFAVAFIGDPHLDNKGHNLAQLESDLEAIRASGMRAINMGDVLDNFASTGKLASKQAANFATLAEGLSLARWFIARSGVRWDAHLLGNHDHWPDPSYEHLLAEWVKEGGGKLHNWSAQITYDWGHGRYTVMASHDFKGHSYINALHGLMRRAMEDGTADLYAAGHRHTAAFGGLENAFRGKHYRFMRVKGYKDADEYAHVKGFDQQRYGHSGVAVINPFADHPDSLCRIFYDIDEAASVLHGLRERVAA